MTIIEKRTTIELKKLTRDHLASFGKKDQSFDKLVQEILNHVDNCDRWWCNNR